MKVACQALDQSTGELKCISCNAKPNQSNAWRVTKTWANRTYSHLIYQVRIFLSIRVEVKVKRTNLGTQSNMQIKRYKIYQT